MDEFLLAAEYILNEEILKSCCANVEFARSGAHTLYFAACQCFVFALENPLAGDH